MSRNESLFFAPILQMLEAAFRQLEAKVPKPVKGREGKYRYNEQSIQQAIVQKLARLTSGLHAIETLLERGLFQEQGIIQRVVDEMEEDVWFLSLAITRNEVTKLHRMYLAHFYAEEFTNEDDVFGSHSSRGMIKRDRIRGYVHRSTTASRIDRDKANAVGKIINKTYSGYVHAASPHIMDMYYPPQFDVSGALKSDRYESHRRHAQNVFYRAVTAFAVAAKALEDEVLFESLRRLSSDVETEMYS